MIRLVVAVLAALTVSGARAGAWLQEPGEAYLRLSTGRLETDRRYNPDGDEVPFDDYGGFRRTTYRDLEAIIYGEVGVHPRVTVLGTGILKSLEARQKAAVSTARGLSDVMLGVRTKLWKSLWHVGSVSAEWWLPTGYDETHYPALGSGAHEVRMGAHAGASAGRLWANLDVQVGLRQSPFRDRMVGLMSAGYSLSSRLAVRGTMGVLEPLGRAPADAPEQALFDPTAVDTRLAEASATVSYALGRWALEGELRGPLRGENTLAGTRFGLAVATARSVRLWGQAPGPGPWGSAP